MIFMYFLSLQDFLSIFQSPICCAWNVSFRGSGVDHVKFAHLSIVTMTVYVVPVYVFWDMWINNKFTLNWTEIQQGPLNKSGKWKMHNFVFKSFGFSLSLALALTVLGINWNMIYFGYFKVTNSYLHYDKTNTSQCSGSEYRTCAFRSHHFIEIPQTHLKYLMK